MSKLGHWFGHHGAPDGRSPYQCRSRVALHSRSGAKFTDAGGKACANAREVAQQADVIFLIVPDTPHGGWCCLGQTAWLQVCHRARPWST